MKSVLIISVATFFVIFGGLAILSSQLGKDTREQRETLQPVDHAGTELILKGLDAERALVRREKEELVTLRQAVVVQEQVLEEGRRELEAMVRELETKHRVLEEDRDRSAGRLAKMYENMKPGQAAPILANLEMETILDILRRMKEREAARILASMEPALAAEISMELSQGGAG